MAAKPKKEILTYYGQCACCKEYGYLKRLGTDHNNAGQIENYAKIIEETFCIAVHLESGDKQICEPCIMMLRDASNFKNEIITSAHYSNDGIKIEVKHEQNDNDEDKPYIDDINDEDYKPIKGVSDEEEVDDDEYEEVYDEEGAGDEEGDDDTNDEKIESQEEFEIEYLDEDAEVVKKTVIKNEIEYDTDDEPKPYVIKKKGAIRSYKNYSQTELNRCIEAIQNNDMKLSDAAKFYKIPRKTLIAKMNKLKIKTDNATEREPPERDSIKKHRQNITEILKNTNATPIRGHWGIGYTCYYCPKQYKTASELKIHTLKHNTQNYTIYSMFTYSAKLDVTGLNCRICHNSIDNLPIDGVIKHLIKHGRVLHSDIRNRIVPFKIEDNLQCVVCDEVFKYFKLLASHMSVHFSNYTCSYCGKGFITKHARKTHIYRHITGIHKCKYCHKEFDSRIKVRDHERVVHKLKNKTQKCSYCVQKFVDVVHKMKHEVEVHKAKEKDYDCEYCEKVFISQRSLTAHVKRTHYKLKPHKCKTCFMEFFKKSSLLVHMVKHTKVKDYACDVCGKLYYRRNTLVQHLRLHNEKSYLCALCDAKFTWKCGLENHMQCHVRCVDCPAHQETPEDEEEKKQYKLKHNQFIEEIEKLLTLTNCTPFKVRAFRFYCAYCYLNGPFFEDAEDLYSHTMSHKKNRIKSIDSVLRPVWMNEILRIDITHLKCNSCDIRLIGWNEMFQHFHEIHSVTFDQAYTRLIPYKLEYELHCALCKEQFSTFYHLDSHMNAHYDNYLCSECGDSFMSETRLKKHVETHENGNFECEYCMKTFTLKKYRAKHIALVHKKKKIFKCLYCNEKFISDHVRHQHIVENHNETLKHINCEICGKLFSFRPYYMAHMRKYHSEVKKYKCDYCSKGFVTKYDHKMHVLRHTGEGKHICTVCSKNFVTGRELRSHSKIHEKNQ